MPKADGPDDNPVIPDRFWRARAISRRDALLGIGGIAASLAPLGPPSFGRAASSARV